MGGRSRLTVLIKSYVHWRNTIFPFCFYSIMELINLNPFLDSSTFVRNFWFVLKRFFFVKAGHPLPDLLNRPRNIDCLLRVSAVVIGISR